MAPFSDPGILSLPSTGLGLGLGLGPSKKEPILKDGTAPCIAAQTFTFRELVVATKNFRQDCLLGEGGFGGVYKGLLEGIGKVSLGVLLAGGHWEDSAQLKKNRPHTVASVALDVLKLLLSAWWIKLQNL